MAGIIKKVEQKLGDHPNASSDSDVNPSSGVGIGANDGHDKGKSWTENKIQAGMGSESTPGTESTVKAGNTTSSDTQPAVVGSGSLQSKGE